MRQAPAFAVLLATILALVGAASVKTAAADPTISAKRAEAEAVLGQIREIDSQLSLAIEAYNLANVRLDEIDADLETNARHLTIARSGLKASQRHLARRLVSLYVNGSQASGLEVLLGAESLDHLLTRLDAVDRVTAQDARVAGEVKRFKAQVQSRKAKLERARRAQAREVSERAAQRRTVESQLRERERLLAGVRDEIARLEAAEAQRQARLEAQARARVAALALRPENPATVAPAADVAVAAGAEVATEEAPLEVAAEVAPPAARYGGVVGIAMQFLGVPYRWGGADPSGFDCSGFSMYVYAQVGVSLPHHAASQYGMGSAVSKSDLQPGDLVFFNGLGHMGIYIGGGQFVHAPHTGDVVKVSNLSDSWYANTWVGARRI